VHKLKNLDWYSYSRSLTVLIGFSDHSVYFTPEHIYERSAFKFKCFNFKVGRDVRTNTNLMLAPLSTAVSYEPCFRIILFWLLMALL
jgi:hypothetical protein